MNGKTNKGIIRNIDSLGRVVIPKEFRKMLNIKENEPVEIVCENGAITVKKHNDSCILCGSKEDLKNVKNVLICEKCLEEMKDIIS
ncbi:AbrB/MazE/SpoVT family DNA-binding domain-containing protein [Paraclostridium sordellii]|uniref:AbrB/MazE/SpoVT family DNA-binding domain-containing protein n=1 Tax=Paraclostridium sordellii TaxID=1505 RepID=UPI001F06A892|nr:AbrB/MazE/SpoVT family DNA-binding domain-containing protein [Paeniclostridium sordellii]MCH1965934.1 AbrB/MazE/SpoVT family DNA-binding domain-containing protein [Paeniclostridium sordellii]